MDILNNLHSFQALTKAELLRLPSTASVSDLPHDDGLYFLFDQDDSLLYVGKSLDIHRRWCSRRDFALGRGYRLHYRVGNNRIFNSLEDEEAFLISLFAPRFNQSIRCRVFPRTEAVTQ